jgi:hypothetical protein
MSLCRWSILAAVLLASSSAVAAPTYRAGGAPPLADPPVEPLRWIAGPGESAYLPVIEPLHSSITLDLPFAPSHFAPSSASGWLVQDDLKSAPNSTWLQIIAYEPSDTIDLERGPAVAWRPRVLADLSGVAQVTPTAAAIPLPGAVVSGIITLAFVGLGTFIARLRRRD